MKARPGQVALYLVATLVAICVLAVMNVAIYLSVTAKNRAMNACDAASLAVATHQGDLLNKIGHLNVRHLKILLDDSLNGREHERSQRCEEIVSEQKRICFLEPIKGIGEGTKWAERNGVDEESKGGMRKILEEHVNDIIDIYAEDQELFPEPWEGAWREYASCLGVALGNGVIAGPENPEFADAWTSFPLVCPAFYNAIAGRQWCWFKFNGKWVLDCDSSNMPRPNFKEPSPQWNSEIYSLHLTFRRLVIDENMARILSGFVDVPYERILSCRRLRECEDDWAFFEEGAWGKWSEPSGSADGFAPGAFPIVGQVKSEYDVRGCAAKCRVVTTAANPLDDDADTVVFTSAAKPFGTLTDADGEIVPVTACGMLVLGGFSQAKLVPTDSVGGADLDGGADYDWVRHVRKHLDDYFSIGPGGHGDCWYCQQLVLWENPSFRQLGIDWLRYRSDECAVSGEGGTLYGGTSHAH